MSSLVPSPEDFVHEESRICSRHFRQQDFYVVGGKKRLKCTALPTLHLESSGNEVENMVCKKAGPVMFSKNARIPLSENSPNVFHAGQHSTRQSVELAPKAVNQSPLPYSNKLKGTERERNANVPKAPVSQVPEPQQATVSEVYGPRSTSSVNQTILQPEKKRKMYAVYCCTYVNCCANLSFYF